MNKYNRQEDIPNLLSRLDERTENFHKFLSEKILEQAIVMQKLIEKQNKTPCDTHSLRLKTIERLLTGVGSAVILLISKLLYDVFVRQ